MKRRLIITVTSLLSLAASDKINYLDMALKAQESKNQAEAYRYFVKAGEQGNAIAQYQIGLLHDSPWGDHEKAVKWYTKAANQGHTKAQFSLAYFYHRGRGGEVDYSLAFKWYTIGAEHGEAYCQYNLANFYKNGVGVKQDDNLAFKWYTRAAEQGHKQAQEKASKLKEKFSTRIEQI
ncbi:tetratricopeptide repeat protein [Thalassotalea sp. Y01]|uniref:tetratricopeptide repeat protein n=1 Tax=Thalassotalea sp. Y01 TaxID=2729613 RepID=UPI00145CFFFA|nr:tetratricopeptide repeat protein [Thalassotalea sp. Y01]NMP16414.1 sel1 repeat family protein [Thalassotalea sp. Y01]